MKQLSFPLEVPYLYNKSTVLFFRPKKSITPINGVNKRLWADFYGMFCQGNLKILLKSPQDQLLLSTNQRNSITNNFHNVHQIKRNGEPIKSATIQSIFCTNGQHCAKYLKKKYEQNKPATNLRRQEFQQNQKIKLWSKNLNELKLSYMGEFHLFLTLHFYNITL